MAQIYISYNAGQSLSGASILAERIEIELKRHFNGALSVYRDTQRISADVIDYAPIDRELSGMELMVVVVGADWTPEDPVRHEIEIALANGVQMLIVFSDDGAFPEDLPDVMLELLGKPSVNISAENFYADLREVVEVVERMVSRPRYGRYLMVSILSVFVMIFCAFIVIVALNIQFTPIMDQAVQDPTASEDATMGVGVMETALPATPAPATPTREMLDDVTEVPSTPTRIVPTTLPVTILPTFTFDPDMTVIAVTMDVETNDMATLAPTDTPTPLATMTPVPSPTPSQTPSQTPRPTLMLDDEDANIVISGETTALGDASVYVFHDLDYEAESPMNVALQLFFDTVNITATPRSAVTSVPVTQEATRPAVDPVSATETPAPARFVDQIDDVPPIVVASLMCPSGFEGCGDHPDRFNLRIDEPNEWAWSVIPPQVPPDVGVFTVQLWRADESGRKTNDRLFTHSMTIGTAGGTNVLIPVIIAGVVIFGLGSAVIAWRMARANQSLLNTNDPNQPVKPKSARGMADDRRPSAFISYRRNPSWGVALKIHDTLTERGANVFMDVHDLRDGVFSETLEREIKEREYLILVLAPTTLESEWVRREVKYALENKSTIIPVLTDGFNFETDLPEDLAVIGTYNAITLTLEYYDAAINRIAKFLGVE